MRFPEENGNGAIEGNINQSSNTLRMHAEHLNKNKTYIVYCDSGSRSSVAAFLLSKRGFDVHCLRGGLLEYGILSAVEQRFSDDLSNSEASDGELTIEPNSSDDLPITVAALVPASHQTEIEQDPSSTLHPTDADDVVDAEIKAQALKAELAKANIKLEEARRYKEQAELAREQVATTASETLKIARRLKQEAETAKRRMDEEVAARLKEEQDRLADDAHRAKAVLDDAQRIKEEITRQKEIAEAEAEQRRLDQEAQFETMRLEAERRMREEEKKLAESYAWQAEELARLQKMKDEAESELKLERERLKTEASEAKTRLREAQRIQHEVEQTRIESSKEAEERQLG